MAERFHVPTLEDDGYLIDNSYKKSCREILSSKKKIKWPVYNKSALIGTLKKKTKKQKNLPRGDWAGSSSSNWFYSDGGWFHRLWALGNSVKYLPLEHSAIQTEPLIVIQNAKNSFAISALKVVLKAPEGRKNGREVERK